MLRAAHTAPVTSSAKVFMELWSESWPFSTICLCAVLAGAPRPSLRQIDFILDSWIPIDSHSAVFSLCECSKVFLLSLWWRQCVMGRGSDWLPHCLSSVLTKPPQVFIQQAALSKVSGHHAPVPALWSGTHTSPASPGSPHLLHLSSLWQCSMSAPGCQVGSGHWWRMTAPCQPRHHHLTPAGSEIASSLSTSTAWFWSSPLSLSPSPASCRAEHRTCCGSREESGTKMCLQP